MPRRALSLIEIRHRALPISDSFPFFLGSILSERRFAKKKGAFINALSREEEVRIRGICLSVGIFSRNGDLYSIS